ncbi:Uma2 family endonuclease [Streptomyces anulatus]|uniref:Uma2 family endonuclease n=1 Tax=Streptomyces anulatus TaxID=1892 RepID=UPI0033E3AF11
MSPRCPWRSSGSCPVAVETPDGHAAAGIPVYLLVDREACSVTVFTEPEKGAYRSATTRPFGAVVELPGPVGFALDTEKLREYAERTRTPTDPPGSPARHGSCGLGCARSCGLGHKRECSRAVRATAPYGQFGATRRTGW